MGFQCYWAIMHGQEKQGDFKFEQNSDGTLQSVRGWAVNVMIDGPGTQHPRGFTPLEVRLRMDGKFLGQGFQQIANITRKDLNKSSGVLARIPNLEHGFVFDMADIPA